MPSQAATIEIRWRIAGSGNAWTSKSVRANTSSIKIEGLERGESYEGEARALSAAGTPSDWAPVNFTVADPSLKPRAPTSLTVLSIADAVSLKWNVDADQPADVDYSIEVATASGGPYSEFTRTRAKQYSLPLNDGTVRWFRVRAVNFGVVYSAYSNTVSGAAIPLAELQAEAAEAKADAALALAELSDIANDGKLTASEKIESKREYDTIFDEVAGIDADAEFYGITTQRTDWSAALDSLKTYLRVTVGVLNGSNVWVDVTGTTAIVRNTWNSAWKVYYATRQNLLNKIVNVAADRADVSNLVKKGVFEDGESGSWQLPNGSSVVTAPFGSWSKQLRLFASSYEQNGWFTVKPGEVINISAGMNANNIGIGNTAQLILHTTTATGASAGFSVAVSVTAPVVAEERGGNVVVPAGAVRGRVLALLVGTDGTTQWLGLSNVRAIRSVDAGGAFNFPPGSFANVGAAWVSGGSMSYTASAGTPATATINVTALTLRSMGSDKSYSASSVGVTGTNGATVTFHLYYDDPTFAGGARTLGATTSMNTIANSRSRILVGSLPLTFPSSGSGGGTRPTPCPTVDSVLACGRRAGRIRIGNWLRLADPYDGLRARLGKVSRATPALAPCVRLTTDRGAVFECSTSAPIPTRDGYRNAPDTVGCEVPIRRVRWAWLRPFAWLLRNCDWAWREGWERIVSAGGIGEQWVMHITCENACFWVGKHMHAQFLHHNIKHDPLP